VDVAHGDRIGGRPHLGQPLRLRCAAVSRLQDHDILHELYAHRFTPRDVERKHAVWKEIARWLQRYVDPRLPVLDVACDRGFFIANIAANERWATDLRDVSDHLPAKVRFVQCSGLDISAALPHDHFGTVFMSNYLEHLATPDTVLEQLIAAAAVTRPGGRLLVLQPNIRLVRERYWDFLDHRVAMTEKNLCEACETAGFITERLIVRFLPYTTKSRLPQGAGLVRAYLRCPPARWLLGKQTLYVGVRAA
jgi:SAM-dependent methyltransferase